MPLPDAYAKALLFKKQVDALDQAALNQLAKSYGSIWIKLRRDIDSLLADVAGKQMSFNDVAKLNRYKSLIEQVEKDVTDYATRAATGIKGSQTTAVRLSQAQTRQLVDASLPRGITTSILAELGIPWNVFPREALNALAGFASNGTPLDKLLQPLGSIASQGVKDGLTTGLGLGYNPTKTADLIRDKVGMSLTRALTISRTETLRAYREASRLQYAANDAIVKKFRRVAAHDGGTCLACLALDGKEYDTDELLEIHPNCLIGESLVSAEGVSATSERWYEGEVITIRTASGYRLTCTPNHPILTNSRWIAAGLLDIGSDIISRVTTKGETLNDVYNKHMPTAIKKIAHSFGKSLNMAAVPVPVSAEDFHGDGGRSKIAVIKTDGLLRDDFEAPVSEHLCEFHFQRRHVVQSTLLRSGMKQLTFDTHHSPRSPKMGVSSLPHTLLWRHAAPLHRFGLALGSQLNASVAQSAVNSVSAYAIPSTEDIRRIAGDVFADKVIDIWRRPFAGHVYNLQTSSGMYVADSIVTHNCRCAIIPVTLSYADLGLNINEAPDNIETAEAWFKNQSDIVKRDMMGDKRFEAYQAGQFKFQDLATVIHDDKWGDSLQPTTISGLLPKG